MKNMIKRTNANYNTSYSIKTVHCAIWPIKGLNQKSNPI